MSGLRKSRTKSTIHKDGNKCYVARLFIWDAVGEWLLLSPAGWHYGAHMDYMVLLRVVQEHKNEWLTKILERTS